MGSMCIRGAVPALLIWFAALGFAGCDIFSSDSGGGFKLTATPGKGIITLTWDDVTDAASYNVAWANSSDVEGGEGATITGSMEGVTSPFEHIVVYGETYYYIATAVKTAGGSSKSKEANAASEPLPLEDIAFVDGSLIDCVGESIATPGDPDWGENEGAEFAHEIITLVQAMECYSVGTIEDLDGIEYLTSLTALALTHNEISDVSLLSTLVVLEELYIFDNDIVDVSPLATLVNLITLDLNNNQITTGVADLVTLVNATSIDLSNNPDLPCADVDTLEAALSGATITRPAQCLA